eukprot:RCo033667
MAVNFGPASLFVAKNGATAAEVPRGPPAFSTLPSMCHSGLRVNANGIQLTKASGTGGGCEVDGEWISAALAFPAPPRELFRVTFRIVKIGNWRWVAFGVVPRSHPDLSAAFPKVRPGQPDYPVGVSFTVNGELWADGQLHKFED